MGSLGLHADPDGWLNAGYSVRTLMDSLDSELYDADRIGGAGLSQSWAGPVAEAFTGHWSGRPLACRGPHRPRQAGGRGDHRLRRQARGLRQASRRP